MTDVFVWLLAIYVLFALAFFFVNGEVLVAEPFGNLNWATGIDMKTAQPIVNPAMHPLPDIKLDTVAHVDRQQKMGIHEHDGRPGYWTTETPRESGPS